MLDFNAANTYTFPTKVFLKSLLMMGNSVDPHIAVCVWIVGNCRIGVVARTAASSCDGG
jgi:hypothetical protein